MIAIFGFSALFLALIASFIQGTLPLLGFYKHNPFLKATARPSVIAQTVLILIAYALLTYAFVNNDFSIEYVAANSHPDLPFIYRLTAVWGGHEGSILLWILLLSFWSLVLSFTYSGIIKPLVISILGLTSFCFLAFLIFTSNPFLPAQEFLGARDLNPLLQDPGFVIHPPILYIGYVGFAVPFALCIAGLLTHRLDSDWALATRKYALGAWCFLTFGIALGSWWAYRVLGWGGFWFWDPVENASLLPWIAGTALIHVLILTEKTNRATYWGALLAIIAFALSVLGTFLVRSGILVSAHTFANDPARGVFLLLLFAVVMIVALTIFFLRLKPQVTTTLQLKLSKEIALLLNSAVLIVMLLTVLLGTLYPLIIDALGLGAISVGAPYFNLVMTPLIFFLLCFMAIAPYYQWQFTSAKTPPIWKNLLISSVITFSLYFSFEKTLTYTIIFLILCNWMILNLLGTWFRKPGMFLAHLGFAILLIGIILSSTLSHENQISIRAGETTQMGPYKLLFKDLKRADGANYRGIQAAFEVTKNNRHLTFLYPEKRYYQVREMVMTKVDIYPTIFRDLYIALGESLENDNWSLRVYYKPFIRWIWFGGVLMMVGGLISINRKTASKKKSLIP